MKKLSFFHTPNYFVLDGKDYYMDYSENRIIWIYYSIIEG